MQFKQERHDWIQDFDTTYGNRMLTFGPGEAWIATIDDRVNVVIIDHQLQNPVSSLFVCYPDIVYVCRNLYTIPGDKLTGRVTEKYARLIDGFQTAYEL